MVILLSNNLEKNSLFNDDFSAVKGFVDEVVRNDGLAKSTAIHNFASMTGPLENPLIYLVWPTPNKGYKNENLLRIWDKIRYNCFMDETGHLRDTPIMLLGRSSDSACFQLAAANSLMTPNENVFNKGIKYLTLGIGESHFASPYFGPLPSTMLILIMITNLDCCLSA